MIKIRSVGMLLGGLAALALLCTASWAEDFSVDLNRLAEIDPTQPLPEYKLDRVFSRDEGSSDMPEKIFAVFLRFKEFGEVRLAESKQAGPSTGKEWSKDMTFNSGLASLADVKIGWLKHSPGLLLVAWVDEPDGCGVAHIYGHGYLLLQLQDHRATVLLRSYIAITTRLLGGIQEGSLDYPRFSFDPERGLLNELQIRDYEESSNQPGNLLRPWKDEGGADIFLASIHEAIHLSYKIANGKLLPGSCSLIYKTQKHDELSEIARFYLGPDATRSVLLVANPSLAAKYKDHPRDAFIYLEEGAEIKVPVPEESLLQKCGHGLAAKQKER